MTINSAQGHIKITRSRLGHDIFLVLELENGIPLQQMVDPQSGKVAPDWSVEGNQPIIHPVVRSHRERKVVVKVPTWKYNDIELNFEGAEVVNGWVVDSTQTFQMEQTTGRLRIIKNLASKENSANDTLEFSCQAVVDGDESIISKSIDVYIVKGGASSYLAGLTASPAVLDEHNTTSKLKTSLMLNLAPVTEYTVVWKKDDEVMAGTDAAGLPITENSKQITIGRDDVDGSQIFIAEFFIGKALVERAHVYVEDFKDEFGVTITHDNKNMEVDVGVDVPLTANVIRRVGSTASIVTLPPTAKWVMAVYNFDSLDSIRTVVGNKITITTADTDNEEDGTMHDVEVTAEVEW